MPQITYKYYYINKEIAMEVLLFLGAVIAVLGWWIWREGQHEKNGHPLENVTNKELPVAPVLTGTVHTVDVGNAAPAEAVAIVEKAQAKARKAPARKTAEPKAKKPGAKTAKPKKISK